MLRLIQIGNALPTSFICDPSANFMPGMIAQLCVNGNQVMATVSNGTAPIGIIDDINTRAFTSVSWNEVLVSPPMVGVFNSANQLVCPNDVVLNLAHAYITPASFVSTVDVELNQLNGTITFPAGTVLNYDLLGTGSPNALQTVVNYTYQVPNIAGDSSIQGSGRMTVWFQRGFFQTDQFETQQAYPVMANLYCSEAGLLTTRRPSPIHPAIAMCTAPPLGLYAAAQLEFLWY
jgi:hypothetical protein